ncbi:MAG: discoidin domain-containing protein [Phycisphaerae bacterium]|nr:discoidin domain-containing protein [Phycisphaerae bacterium]
MKNIFVLSMTLLVLLAGQLTAQTNLALSGSATASSMDYGWVEANGIDGNTGTGYHSVEAAALHWYEVDLGTTCQLSKVEIVNRGGFLARLNGAIIKLLAADRTELYVTDPVADSPTIAIFDNAGEGFRNVRYVRVEKDSAQGNPLTIMELRAIDAATAAVNVSPVNGSVGVLIDKNDTSELSPTLQWTASANVTAEDISGYYVFFGTDAAVIEAAAQGDAAMLGSTHMTATSYQHTADLEKDETYYWRVDTRLQDDPNTIIGAVWSFGTELTLPQIDLQPQDMIVPEGTDGLFTIEATDPLGGNLLYQWWIDPNAVVENDEYALTDGADYIGVATPQLTITAVDDDDDAMYYCVVTNAANVAKVQSTDQAQLIIGKQLGYWAFDGNLTDAKNGNTATNTGETAEGYDAGLIGDGQALDCTASAGITVQNTLDTSSWSFTWWEKADATGTQDWESMLAAGPSAGYENFEFNRYQSARYAHGINGNAYRYTDAATPLPRQQWYFHAVTFNQYTTEAVWYIDGVTLTKFNVGGVPAIDELIYVGDTRDGGQPYSGLIDDLKFYNYPVSPVHVATEYTDVVGGWVCTEVPAGDYDGNCIVDINDLSVMATDWLASGFFPL